MKKILSVVSVFAFVLVLFTQGVSAEELSDVKGKVYISQIEKEQLKKGFDELGIDKDTQIKLIKKLENGEMLDSMKEENLQKVANTSKIGLNDSNTITFDDGSKIVYGNELVDKGTGIQPMLASGSYTVKSYWNTVILKYSFETDFVIRSGADNDYIVNSYNPNVTIFGGTVKDKTVTVVRKYETSTRRAYSRMDFSYEGMGGTGYSDVDLFFQVGDNDYETTLSRDDAK